MFRKTRNRIVLTVTAVLAAFLAVTLATIYGSSYLSAKKQNEEMLERYVAAYSPESPPSDLPPEEEFFPDEALPSEGDVYRLSSFYSVAFSGDGSVLAVDTGRGLCQTAEIVETAREILADGKAAGMLDGLLYRVEAREGYTLAAFLDTTITDESLRTLLLYMLVIGAAMIGVFAAVSVFLAKRIVRPLEENDRKQRQFVSDAGHELKTPVSVVTANAEILSREIGENRWLDNIRYENDRMGRLVKDLLALSRAESAAPAHAEIDLSRLVGQEVLPFESVAYEHGLTIVNGLEEQVAVRGDAAQLGRLISILVDNAVSYSYGGTRIEISLRKEHHRAVLIVVNPGEAIPEDARERLFDRFFRTDESRSGSEGHFGLGLPIAEAIARAHGGKIRIDCADGKVMVVVSLPLASA